MLSIIITSHHDDLGLYLTYYAIRQQLALVSEDWEIIIIADGGTEIKFEKLSNSRVLRGCWGSPQASRDAGIRAAQASDVLVMESHVICSDVGALVGDHRRLREYKDAALTFAYRTAESSEMFDVYGAETDWDGTLWFKRLVYTKQGDNPYPVSQFGHSCFVVDRQWYLDSGGYGSLLNGWGGEEPLLCLKAWMLGRSCWLVPDIWQAHYLTPGAHAGRTSEPEYLANLGTVAYILGGDAQAQKLHGRYMGVSVDVAAAHAERERICAGPYQGDLTALRRELELKGIR